MSSRGTEKEQKAVDQFVGGKIKFRRKMLGLSQQELAERLEISASLMYMFEAGDIQVGASYLYDFADILRVPVAFFFDGYRNNEVPPGGGVSQASAEELYQLVECFDKLEGARLRKAFQTFIHSLGDYLDPSN